ncbi:MAG: ABC transporter ATP-binding protein [Chloroflexi bacterium]|nr:ABC transporter ATP-binding protein [Chloroflexota bacterium]MCI0646004.1 ABC transporter ATP-binding protein [Chloroflexota bacterium]MCI0726847.1 ABC transporter ATP-binding protein [Chloroflexota bacterium]
MTLLEIKGLAKNFGGLQAINHLDFHVDEGEIVSVIGPNGAGKTTFFNLISGFYPPDSGEILFEGQSVVGLTPDQITKRGIARTFQNVRLFRDLTILENVMCGQHCRTSANVLTILLNLPRVRAEEIETRKKAEEVLAFFGSRLVGYRLNQPARVLSYANRRRLEIARAMATDARLLLLDEPTAGMNPRETLELTGLISRLRDEKGYTLIVIEHDMQVVKGVSDRVVVLDYGQKIAEGSYSEVAQNERVLEAYLGRKGAKEHEAAS